MNNKLVLSEIWPNPPGADKLFEFVELQNKGQQAINLQGWQIADLKRTFNLPAQRLLPGDYFIVKRPQSKIALNNTKEVVFLKYKGQVKDQVAYQKSKSGWSYSLISNRWRWTKSVTPQSENKLTFEYSKLLEAQHPPLEIVLGDGTASYRNWSLIVTLVVVYMGMVAIIELLNWLNVQN